MTEEKYIAELNSQYSYTNMTEEKYPQADWRQQGESESRPRWRSQQGWWYPNKVDGIATGLKVSQQG